MKTNKNRNPCDPSTWGVVLGGPARTATIPQRPLAFVRQRHETPTHTWWMFTVLIAPSAPSRSLSRILCRWSLPSRRTNDSGPYIVFPTKRQQSRACTFSACPFDRFLTEHEGYHIDLTLGHQRDQRNRRPRPKPDCRCMQSHLETWTLDVQRRDDLRAM